MKKIFYSIIAAVAAVAVSSCSLEENTDNITSPYNYYQNAAQVRSALNACYIPLTSIYSLAYMIAVEGVTDIASCNGSAQKDAKLDIQPSSTGCGSNVWEQCYKGIRYCLSTLAGIERADKMEEEVKAPLRAEAVVMMSFYYYLLTCHFGNVPFYLDYVQTDEDIDRIGKLPRMSADVTRATLINLLESNVPALPQIRTSDVENNYSGAAMGWMLIAKMAAWNEDWDEVIRACGKLEEIYGDIMQYPYSDVMWRYKNTPESIFEIQHTWSPGGLSKTSSVGCLCMPYPRTAGTDIYAGVQIEILGSEATTYASLRPTSYFRGSLQKENSGDIRRDFNIVNKWNGQAFNGNNTWMGPKFWCPGQYTTYDHNNYRVFRYADALLLMAEAYCEKKMFDESIRYYNMIRKRANMPEYSNDKSLVKVREEIRRERARELIGEFGRKYDLVRWGTWYAQVVQYNTYNLIQENIKPCHEYYPIPDTEVMASGGALDNDEYKKYGIGE